MKLTIERLGHLGDAIAQGENGPIFVAQMLPGEEVEGELVGSRLENARIVTPSPDRVRPPCAHARSCGGCMMQHAKDDFVAAWKMDVVRSALAGQGLEADLRPILTSPPQSRRRATIAGAAHQRRRDAWLSRARVRYAGSGATVPAFAP